ncbi:helix-turn-helix domain-containing protein [Paenibacillus sp. LHD-38]|uniref:response regulator transcription factor n=1 Tax=Paenibacillus sp. LHD-38 TaxID=3072143 RepID=UPI00280F8DFC|nr:helix-turn-helix domain-containing protein [Paenibacillus sp. LHD-38]MDQ8736783.1 helix-turn-helix domain-containing protein [Paenibacillus sp. LHD-38]
MLIVDDDKLVRKGLIVLMPWQKFGLKVIGEAANGEAALQFLENNDVDILITDLAMPVMSGIELMRTVRIRYPNIWLVVLTFHQDFEYIQESLRLGAIDYIVKLQLEKEKMDDVLTRIMGRITEETGKRNSTQRNLPEKNEPLHFQSGSGVALISLNTDAEQDDQWPERLPLNPGDYLTEAEQGVWLWVRESGEADWLTEKNLHECLQIEPDIVIIRLSDLEGFEKSAAVKWLREFRHRGLLYELEDGKRYYNVSLVSEQQNRPIVFDEDILDMHKRWSSLAWVNNDLIFDRFQAELKQMMLSKEKLESIFYSAFREWERTLSTGQLSVCNPIGSLMYWYEWVEWLGEIRRSMIELTNKAMYSRPIVESILKAADLIAQDITQQIGLIEMANSVNMSRSYFSQCFKDILGKPFNEYIRDRRIAKAEELLAQTGIPIIRIAEKTGYPNEKYFSRLFREQTGMTPSDYRQQQKQGAQLSDE